MRRVIVLLASLALILALAPTASLAAPSSTGTWIVELRSGVASASVAHALAGQHGGRVGHVYTHALNGFSFRGSQAAASALMRNPNVARIEADAEVWLDTTQANATWGLDRIDQRNRPLDGSYTYDETGAGVNAYVIDSGIRYSHTDFGGRAVLGHDVVGGITPAGSDCNGHGTHVAGTIGGATWGVAKHATLYSVRVFGCSSSSSWEVIIAGIDWVTANHVKPAVANLSIGGPGSSMVDTAVQSMINAGVATAVAAGNGDWLGRQANACNYSPARVPDAMTISATNSSDAKVSWANYGNCVDWFAPGVSIVSASHGSDTGSATKSGTSMAAPHTAGVAALYLQANPGASPTAVRDAIYAETTKGIVTSSSTTNNHLLYMGFLNGGGSGGTAPVANFSATPTNGTVPLEVTFSDTSSGAPTSWSWSFGDGNSSLLQHPTHTYEAAGTYTVSLTATNASGSDIETKVGHITVSEPPAGGISLSAIGYKVQGVKRADLTWVGATSTHVDVYRNNVLLLTTANDGSHTDNTGQRGGGSNTYRVCEAGTITCSNTVTVSY